MFKAITRLAKLAGIVTAIIGAASFGDDASKWGEWIGEAAAMIDRNVGLIICGAAIFALSFVPYTFWVKLWGYFTGADLTDPNQLTGPFIKGHTFRIAHLAVNNLLNNKTFEGCTVYGPAVVIGVSMSDIYECTHSHAHDIDKLVWTLQPGRMQKLDVPCGVIYVDRCTFRRCHFVDIGFVDTKANVNKFKKLGAMIEGYMNQPTLPEEPKPGSPSQK